LSTEHSRPGKPSCAADGEYAYVSAAGVALRHIIQVAFVPRK
jgi:hypothetical protein